MVEYTVVTVTLDADGVSEETSELFCLITTLLDPASVRARELAELYTARWTSETIFKHIKIEQRGGQTATLRSNNPAMVEQELWAMLCVYQAIHQLAAETADRAHLPVSHISFKQTLAAARRSVGADFPPRQLTAKIRHVQDDLREAVKPRPGRAAPRGTKRSGTPLPQPTARRSGHHACRPYRRAPTLPPRPTPRTAKPPSDPADQYRGADVTQTPPADTSRLIKRRWPPTCRRFKSQALHS
ncbi:transposase [Streptomyces sp. NPDC001156]